MELIFSIVIGVLILVFLVVIHELGHAIVAQRNGVVVEEFGVGFPPRAWGKKLKNGIYFTINWLPLGGFVKLKGEHDSAKKKGDYGAASYWQKTKILLAGVAMNWFVAAGILTVLAWVGLPKILPGQFTVPADTVITKRPVELTVVAKDSPAEKAGLKIGDAIVRFAGESVPSAESLSQQTKAKKGHTVEIIYSRDGMEHSVYAQLLADAAEGKGYLGVGSTQREAIHASWSAPLVGVVTTAQFTGATFQGLGDLVVRVIGGVALQFSSNADIRQQAHRDLEAASSSVAGPVGILGTIFPAAEQAGIVQLAFLTAIISLTLAIMNVLPIPALDGGRWFTMTIFRLMKKPLTKEREERIQGIGFMVLTGLIVVITVVDVGKLFK